MVRARLVALEVGVTALIIALVWRYAQTHDDSLAVARFSEIWGQFKATFLFDRFSTDLVPTLKRLAIGYTCAVVLGVLVGLALGSSRTLRLTTGPLIGFIRAIPPVALIPPMIIVIGLGDNMKLAVVTFVCVWPVALNTADGVREIDATITDTALSFRLSRWERLRWVTLPSIAPRTFAGMHVALAFAMIAVIATEYLAGSNGLGFIINQAQQTFVIAQMWAGVVMLGLLGYLINLAFIRAQAQILYWVPDTRSSDRTGDVS